MHTGIHVEPPNPQTSAINASKPDIGKPDAPLTFNPKDKEQVQHSDDKYSFNYDLLSTELFSELLVFWKEIYFQLERCKHI